MHGVRWSPSRVQAREGAWLAQDLRRVYRAEGRGERDTPGARVWQRNYFEHIIRHERALNAIRRYIAENPLRWHLDRYNPHATGTDPQAQEIWQMMKENARTVGRRALTGGQS